MEWAVVPACPVKKCRKLWEKYHRILGAGMDLWRWSSPNYRSGYSVSYQNILFFLSGISPTKQQRAPFTLLRNYFARGIFSPVVCLATGVCFHWPIDLSRKQLQHTQLQYVSILKVSMQTRSQTHWISATESRQINWVQNGFRGRAAGKAV